MVIRAMQPEAILILDRGHTELVVPADWPVSAQPGGSLKITDPRDQCSLEISCMSTPDPGVTAPVGLFLESTLAGSEKAAERGPIETLQRGPTAVACCTYAFSEMDTDMGRERRAFGRTVFASRGGLHVLVTAAWWEDDDAWARPVVERATETISLGDGRPLAGPHEHWSLRPRN